MKGIGLAGLLLLGLGACGGAAEVADELGEDHDLTALREASDAFADRVGALEEATAIPAAGSATYRGYAGLTLDTPEETALVGLAEVRADFAGDDLTGEVGDVVGRVDGGRVRVFEGELAIGDGDLRVAGPGGFTADVAGELRGGGDVVGVDAGMAGTFRDGADALTAAAVDDSGFTLNGEEVPGALAVNADR